MAQLKRYQDFLDRVDELGFMPLSQLLPGLPSLSGETPKAIWHTGIANSSARAGNRHTAYREELAGKLGLQPRPV